MGQHCGKPEQRHQLTWDRFEGRHERGRGLDGDCPGWLPSVFDPAIPPGGYVCAVEMGTADGICGMPTESEPCHLHGGAL